MCPANLFRAMGMARERSRRRGRRARRTTRAAHARGGRGFFAYLLRCGDGTLYAGYTVDPVRRLASHRRGRASRYTRGRGPVSLAALWRCPTRRDALRLERFLKKLPRAGKHRLARGGGLSPAQAQAALRGARRLLGRRVEMRGRRAPPRARAGTGRRAGAPAFVTRPA